MLKQSFSIVIYLFVFLCGCKPKQGIQEFSNAEPVQVVNKIEFKEAYLQKEIGGQQNEPSVDYLYLKLKPIETDNFTINKIAANGKEISVNKSDFNLRIDVTTLKINAGNLDSYPTIFYSINNQNGSQKIESILIKEPLYRP